MIRQVRREDSQRIWEIRNHPIVRANSSDPEEFSFNKHNDWFGKKYFSGGKNCCFVLENDTGKVIGYCRFDFDNNNDNYIVSIALDPDHHGQGLGHYLLSESLFRFSQEKDILAEIKKNNIPSIKLFQKNKFKIYQEDRENYYLKYSLEK